jgi:hypothetical protein
VQTPAEYLESALKSVPGAGPSVAAKNSIRRSIKAWPGNSSSTADSCARNPSPTPTEVRWHFVMAAKTEKVMAKNVRGPVRTLRTGSRIRQTKTN